MSRRLAPAPGAEPREERRGAGVALMALAVVMFTGVDTSAKWLILAGMAPLQVVWARYAGHLLVALAMTLPRHGLGALHSNAPWRQGLRSGLLFSGTVFNFLALQHLPITVTTTFFFATPIVVTLLAIPLLGERVGLHRVAAVCMGFVGVLVVMQPWGARFDPAMLLSLGALGCASGYFLMTRALAGVESNATSQLWSSGLATICLAPVALPLWRWPQDTAEALVLVLIGGFAAFGHIAATHAHRLAEASVLAPIVYIQIATAALAGIVVFATWPAPQTLAGGLIIIVAGLYIWHRDRRPVHPRPI